MKRLLATLALAIQLPASAMTLIVQGNTVFASGPVNDDLRAFEEALAKPGITSVAFVNSPGGDLWTGLRVGRLIASKGLKTVTAGSCMSACSIMFMGGQERRYADNFHPNLTMVGLHGAHKRDTKQIDSSAQPQIFAFYKMRMGDSFRPEVINQALYEMDDAGAFLRVPDPTRNPQRPPTHCRSGQIPRQQCTVLKDHNALSLGIATHAELVTLDLPPVLQNKPRAMGQELTESLADDYDTVEQLAERQCQTDDCKRKLLSWPGRPGHKAIAIPLEGSGYGYSSDKETPDRALLTAVYYCNHPKGKPARLCEGRIIDQYGLEPLYRNAGQEHAAALGQIRLPTDQHYANEEYGSPLGSAAGLRTQNLRALTPTRLDGIESVDTRTLAQWLQSEGRPTLIDVSGSPRALPTASTLLYGGSAFDAEHKDAAFEQRFAGLLRLLQADMHAAVVFYGQNRENWQAVNAAMRARRLGYTQVYWYRGGLDSWRAAKLPTAPMLLRAVANREQT